MVSSRWARRRAQQQIESESQKFLRLSHCQSDKSHALSQAWRATRTRSSPQILLRNPLFYVHPGRRLSGCGEVYNAQYATLPGHCPIGDERLILPAAIRRFDLEKVGPHRPGSSQVALEMRPRCADVVRGYKQPDVPRIRLPEQRSHPVCPAPRVRVLKVNPEVSYGGIRPPEKVRTRGRMAQL